MKMRISVLGQRQRLNGDELLADRCSNIRPRRAGWHGDCVRCFSAKESSPMRRWTRWRLRCTIESSIFGWAVETILRSDSFLFIGQFAQPGFPDRRNSSSAACRPWSFASRRRARCSWPSGQREWGRSCSIPPTSAAGRKGGLGSASRGDRAGELYFNAGGRRNMEFQPKPDIRKLVERHGKAGSLEQSIQWLCELMFGEAPRAHRRFGHRGRSRQK